MQTCWQRHCLGSLSSQTLQQCCRSAQPMAVSRAAPGRGRASALQGHRTFSCRCHIHEGYQNQCHHSISSKSQPGWLKAAAPLKALWPGQKGFGTGEGTPAKGQVADSICTTCSKERSKKVPFLWHQGAANSLHVTEGGAVLWDCTPIT